MIKRHFTIVSLLNQDYDMKMNVLRNTQITCYNFFIIFHSQFCLTYLEKTLRKESLQQIRGMTSFFYEIS